MSDITITAVIGLCTPERAKYAQKLAIRKNSTILTAHELGHHEVAIANAEQALCELQYAAKHVICEFASETEPTDIIGAFADAENIATLANIVCVVDAAHLMTDLQKDTYFTRIYRHGDAEDIEYVPYAHLAASQIEFASDIVLVNWQQLSTANLSLLMAFVSSLNPTAKTSLYQAEQEMTLTAATYAQTQSRPGWVCVLNNNYKPVFKDKRVQTLRYERTRHFHPGRLLEVLDKRVGKGEFGFVLRSAGFCRLATRPSVVGQWQHAGDIIALEPLMSLGDDLQTIACPCNDLARTMQDIVFFGIDMNIAGLVKALDEALLSDAEFLEDATTWRKLLDPFPEWVSAEK